MKTKKQTIRRAEKNVVLATEQLRNIKRGIVEEALNLLSSPETHHRVYLGLDYFSDEKGLSKNFKELRRLAKLEEVTEELLKRNWRISARTEGITRGYSLEKGYCQRRCCGEDRVVCYNGFISSQDIASPFFSFFPLGVENGKRKLILKALEKKQLQDFTDKLVSLSVADYENREGNRQLFLPPFFSYDSDYERTILRKVLIDEEDNSVSMRFFKAQDWVLAGFERYVPAETRKRGYTIPYSDDGGEYEEVVREAYGYKESPCWRECDFANILILSAKSEKGIDSLEKKGRLSLGEEIK